MNQPTIAPYLTFDGNCREAMQYYQQCLGGELQLMPFDEAPEADQLPVAVQAGIMHACLTKGPLTLMASDANGQPVTPGSTITLSLNCTSAEEISTWFARLAEGGQVTMPLEETFWGATFGMLTDRFGMPWMLNFDHPPAQQ
ncbi:VOC family protein [Hymenobacter sp. B81]|uniref:VOC family protein n=1 Tax=Hymenobacter sp. B81 TaxID=3344878 RepID=UPI0037DDCFBA